MAVVEADPAQHICKCCGYTYQLTAGRIHGKQFMCQGCNNIQNSIRRNLGDTADMSAWSPEESQGFFKRLTDEKKAAGGSLAWKTVRAAMLSTLTEQRVSSFASNVDATELPLSVYVQQGWPEEVIKRFPSHLSEEYGVDVYRVPVRRLKWKEEYAHIERKLLEKEQHCSQHKVKAGEKLDVPEASKQKEDSGGEKGAAKKEAAALKKIQTQNERVANLAARSLGPLSGAESGLSKILAKAEKASSHAPEAKQLCEEQLEKAKEWSCAARAAVNQQQENLTQQAAGAAVQEIAALPFTGEDLKIHLKTTNEAQKALRTSLPQPKAKAKAETKRSAEAAGDGTDAAEPQPKRLRGKTPPDS